MEHHLRWAGLVIAAAIVAGCVSFPNTSGATLCNGGTGVPLLKTEADWDMVVPPPKGTAYAMLGPGLFNATFGAGGAAAGYRLSGTPQPCGGMIRLGVYPGPRLGDRLTVSPNDGPYDLLAGCTGVRLTPIPVPGAAPSYRVAPRNGSGDTMKAGAGGALHPAPNVTLWAHASLFFEIHTSRCGGQNITFLDISNEGLVQAHWTKAS